MIATENSQSLAAFRQNPNQTIDRLNQTGEPEILTVDGEVRAVLVSPAVYDEIQHELTLSRYVAKMKRAIKDIDEGRGQDAEVVFAALHQRLLAMKAAQSNGKSE